MNPPHERSARSLARGARLLTRMNRFSDSPDARELRILSEYLQPLSHFRDEKIHDTIVFFGSARLQEEGPLGRYYREARELARLVTKWSDSLPTSPGDLLSAPAAARGSWKRPIAEQPMRAASRSD